MIRNFLDMNTAWNSTCLDSKRSDVGTYFLGLFKLSYNKMFYIEVHRLTSYAVAEQTNFFDSVSFNILFKHFIKFP
jgi:hypothetical protein